MIGEFSSGKSTLVNALLRDELLATDVLPATTACPTLVRFGDKLQAKALFRDEPHGPYSYRGNTLWDRLTGVMDRPRGLGQDALLRCFLHAATTNEPVARMFARVEVTVLANGFASNLVLIDTPGINAEVRRH